MPKHAIRQDLLARRKQLEPTECLDLGLLAQQRLIDSDCFALAQVVALYSPINNEVQTGQLFAAARAEGKRVCYPRIKAETLEFLEVSIPGSLAAGSFGVAEPQSGRVLPIAELDLIVVPGVAFDRTGHRLGYGKGYYDRELVRVTTAVVSIGLCFDFQLCEKLPRESHDQPVHYLVTEKEFIPCHLI